MMNRLIKKILKEELQGQEFIDNHYKELDRLKGMEDHIIDYLHSEFPNLVEVETRMKKVQLGSTMGFPSVDVIVVTLKFVDLKKEESTTLSPPIKEDIRNIFANYFGFDVMAYGSPIELEFKAQAWVNF
jgi:hypothetical protein